MKQAIHQLCIGAIMLLSFLPAAAYDFEVDGMYYNVLSDTDGTCSVAKASDQIKGIFEIPSKVEHEGRLFTVNEIEAYAFSNNFDITTITIPNSVSKFYPNTFNRNLKELIIADGDSPIYFEMEKSRKILYTSYSTPPYVTPIICHTEYETHYDGLIAPNIEKLYLGRELIYGDLSITPVKISSPIPNSVKILSLGHTISRLQNSYFASKSVSYYSSPRDYLFKDESYIDFIIQKNSIISDSLKELKIINQIPLTLQYTNMSPFITFSSDQYKQLKLYVPSNSAKRFKTAKIWKDFTYIFETSECDILINELNLTPESIELELGVANPFQIKYEISPKYVFNDSISFQSLNPEIAQVSDDGLISAKAIGNTQILLSTTDGSNLVSKLNVNVAEPNRIIKQPTANNLSVELWRYDEFATYTWYRCETINEYSEDMTSKITTNGTYPWIYSADGWISGNQNISLSSSVMECDCEVTDEDSLTLDWKVSSETTYDKLYVYWNNKSILEKSGESSGKFNYTFSATESGKLKFEYKKDSSVNENDDRAWISNVKIIHPQRSSTSIIKTENSPILNKELCNPGDEVWCEIKLNSGRIITSDIVTITEQSGIDDISTDIKENLYTVYNLQGIMIFKTSDIEKIKQLPAGIYIINGKKVLL